MLKFKWLRGLGPVGTLIANILAFLTANWGTAVSVATGVIVALWASAVSFVHDPAVQAGGEIFLATLWTIVAVLYIFDRTKPRSVRAIPDYRYGLTFEGLFPNIDPLNDEQWMTFAIQIRNFSQAPIRYIVEKFDVRLGSRALPEPKKILTGYLPRGGGKTVSPSKFAKNEVKEFFGKRTKGTAKITITYGHPEEKPLRRLIIDMEITLDLPNENEIRPMGFGVDIIGEQDEAIGLN
jgi:hypothetical protein